MKSLKQILGNNLKQYTMIGALVLLLAFFQWKSDGAMLNPSSIQSLISGNSYVLILAIGMVMVIVIGQIDLSVGSVAAVVGMSIALSIESWGIPWWLGLILGLAVGIAIGAWQGFWLSRVGIPGFITTLAGMLMFRGVVVWMSQSQSRPVPDNFKVFGAGYLPDWGRSATNMNNSTLVLGAIAILLLIWQEFRKRSRLESMGVEVAPLWTSMIKLGLITALIGLITWRFASGDPGTSFPVPGIILLGLVIVYHTITQRTTFGRHIYAVGGNKAAAALSGVNVKRTYFLVMANMSFLAAIAAILFIGRSTSAGPSDGTGWELDAIAAVFIGGAAVSGGIGTVIGSMVGGLFMAVLNQGLFLLGVGSGQSQVIKGLVLLAAVAFDVYSKQQGRPSLLGKIFKKREILDGDVVPPKAVASSADGSKS